MSEGTKDDALSGGIARGDRASFFPEPSMDRFVAVMLNMASEMWVMEERLRSLDPTFVHDPEADAAAFVSRIFAPLREPR